MARKHVLTVKGERGKEFSIDLRVALQSRYEMIRECSLTGGSIEEICSKYGLSRTSYYFYKDKFDKGNIEALLPQKPGPKGPVKVTEELEKEILSLRFKDPGLNMYDIWELLREKGHDIGVWSVFSVLKKHGATLKKTKKSLKI